MDTLTITRYDIPVKGVKKKTICHFSDVHLTAYDDIAFLTFVSNHLDIFCLRSLMVLHLHVKRKRDTVTES